jgi:hypothetical protein
MGSTEPTSGEITTARRPKPRAVADHSAESFSGGNLRHVSPDGDKIGRGACEEGQESWEGREIEFKGLSWIGKRRSVGGSNARDRRSVGLAEAGRHFLT